MPDSMLCQEPKQPKLLDQVCQYLRLHHCSIHTERSYVDWIVRFIRFHRMRSRDDLFPAEPKIEVFLTHLATEGNVAPDHQALLRRQDVKPHLPELLADLVLDSKVVLVDDLFRLQVVHLLVPKTRLRALD